MTLESEFSRKIRIDRTRGGDLNEQMEASEPECRLVAERLGLERVSSLRARLTVRAGMGSSLYQVEGTADAEVTQMCAVSGQPFESSVTAQIRALFSEAEILAEDEADSSWDDVEAVEDGMVDLGELAVQHISLALDPYPRKPGVEWAASSAQEDERPPSPFAVLSTLRKEE